MNKEEIIKEFREFVKPALNKGLYETNYTQKEQRETLTWIYDIETFWLSKLAQQKADLLKKIEGMKKKIPYKMESMTDINAHPKEAEVYDTDCGYNQALEDIKKIL